LHWSDGANGAIAVIGAFRAFSAMTILWIVIATMPVAAWWLARFDEPIARLQAQTRLIAAYEGSKRPRRSPRIADQIRHLRDQHGLTRADMVPILRAPSRVSEVLRGKKRPCIANFLRDLCIYTVEKAPTIKDGDVTSGPGKFIWQAFNGKRGRMMPQRRVIR
jgi:hypothetical protein